MTDLEKQNRSMALTVIRSLEIQATCMRQILERKEHLKYLREHTSVVIRNMEVLNGCIDVQLNDEGIIAELAEQARKMEEFEKQRAALPWYKRLFTSYNSI